MGRPRDFDVDAALDAAVELFWARGYGPTSVRQLCDAMGIQPGSFYAAFGSKEACFHRALARYLAGQRLPSEPGPEAIRAWLRAITAPSRRGRGCLLVTSAVEHPLLDPEGQEIVAGRLRAMEDFFAACLRDRSSAKDDAALLSAAVVSIHVLSRSGASTQRLRRVATSALRATGLLEDEARADAIVDS